MPDFAAIWGSPEEDALEREIWGDEPAPAPPAVPDPDEPFDPRRAMRAATYAAWRVTPPRYAYWREDIAQEVALAVYLDYCDGIHAARRRYTWHAVTAARKLFCAGRNPAQPIIQVSLDAALWGADEPRTEARDPLAAVLRVRLEAWWGTLTQAQRAGLVSAIADRHDGSAVANAFGVSVWSLRNARRQAIELVNLPAVRAAEWARKPRRGGRRAITVREAA